ncbi:MAG: GNAT family N-acetyltransferase [Clostridia bacterium]|nr:GNAT family N-acetyltransferase [Clostridia bacterium]
MTIRRAGIKDTGAVLSLLSQVLELHASIRPDIFISGTTKYSAQELAEIFADDSRPVFVAVNETDAVIGYAFCVIRQPSDKTNQVPFSQLYIDDLCVDAASRGQGVGEALFRYVQETAKDLGCYEVTLAVWAGNDGASRFYEKMGMRPKETIMELIL